MPDVHLEPAVPRRSAVQGSPPETALLLPVLHGFLRMQWAHQMSPAAVELPWHQKRIDLAVTNDLGLITVELKVDKWRKAIEQAYLNRWIAEQAWVALWHSHVTPQALKAATDAQVGLMVVTRRSVYPVRYPGRPPRTRDPSLSAAVAAGMTRVRDLLTLARSND